jgi:hypothetical protein
MSKQLSRRIKIDMPLALLLAIVVSLFLILFAYVKFL